MSNTLVINFNAKRQNKLSGLAVWLGFWSRFRFVYPVGKVLISPYLTVAREGGTFRNEGMVLIASNEQLAATDYTSGLERRLMVAKFTRRFSPEQKADFIKRQGEAALHAEIPAIIQWALGLSREDVTRHFMHLPKAMADWSMEALTEQNPVVEWITENLLPDPNAWTQIGERGEKKDHGIVTFMDSDSKLYPNYLHFCYQSKRESLGLTRFRNTVIDMLETLKIPTRSKRHGEGQGIQGVKLPGQSHEAIS